MPARPIQSAATAAYTITELMVTIAIIGILGSVALTVSLSFNRN